MLIKPIEVFSEASNYGVIRMPGRAFPGCVIQGDSLSILLGDAEDLLARVKTSSDDELIAVAEGLVESLRSRLGHYESVLSEHGIPLPYKRGT